MPFWPGAHTAPFCSDARWRPVALSVNEANSARQVRQQLREKGWLPVSVEPAAGEHKSAGQGLSLLRRSMSAYELALITRQLATLIQAGIPVEECLRAVSRQTERPGLLSLLLAVRARVIEGYTLAQSLSEFPQAFPELYRATVAAGERSGHLGHDLPVLDPDDGAERAEAGHVHVQAARADRVAPRQRDAGPVAPGHEGPEHRDRRAEPPDQLVRRLPAQLLGDVDPGDAAGRRLGRVDVRVGDLDAAAQLLEQAAHHLDVEDVGHVVDHAGAGRQEGGSHQLERGVLRTADVHGALERPDPRPGRGDPEALHERSP